ncbi:hypothetical protein SAMN04488085_102297 [Geodermatophilus ruber]|uniref:Uncharacterized protein n=1 Tax=Geodermatophilus ruber TaxID=504800 RepID=A0A1I4ANS3_9ACTN|nr:hypothetical protein SAMN04488085_102297 [Geodermatophilus ruber]
MRAQRGHPGGHLDVHRAPGAGADDRADVVMVLFDLAADISRPITDAERAYSTSYLN